MTADRRSRTPLQWIGALACLGGLVLVLAPTLVSDPGPAADTFEAIERRVRWGALAGLGALLLVHTRLRPWPTTVAMAVLMVTAGFLVARIIGLVLDGMDSGRQWMWTGIEVAIVLVAWAFIARRARKQA
jgi:hypothetical protein